MKTIKLEKYSRIKFPPSKVKNTNSLLMGYFPFFGYRLLESSGKRHGSEMRTHRP